MTLKTKHIRTSECWFPTVEGQVEVSLIDDGRRTRPRWRVCVVGGDDFGLENRFEDKGDARRIFRWIKDHISQDALRRRGFTNF